MKRKFFGKTLLLSATIILSVYMFGQSALAAELTVAAYNTTNSVVTPDYVCDGTDDQAEIQAAIDALGLDGGTVCLLEGTYNISYDLDHFIPSTILSAPIRVKSNVALIGEGEGTVLSMVDSTERSSVISASLASDVLISNLTVDGSLAGSGRFYGIFFKDVTSSKIDTVWAQNMSNTGIQLNGSSYITVSNNHIISNGGRGGSLYASGIRVDHGCSNNTISNNTLRYNSRGNGSGDSYSGAIYLYCASDNTVSGNNIESNSNNYAICLDNSNYNAVSGNNLNGNSYQGIGIGAFCYLGGNAYDNSVIDNKITSNNGYGFYIRKGHGNVIVDNRVQDNGNGISISLSNDNQIYHNNFINNGEFDPIVTDGIANIFNLDEPIGGNYWSRWATPDNDGDGFVDSPYVFSGGQDNLPWAAQDGWRNQAPIADAGTDQTVSVGLVGSLDGSASHDPDGNVPIAYNWSITSAPLNSTAELSDAAIVNPTLTPDLLGDYNIELTVTDSLGAVSAADSVIISTVNSCPEADAGGDQKIHTTALPVIVTLDGTHSWDNDGQLLTYAWQIISQPADSIASLDSPEAAKPTLSLDTLGDYTISLQVDDGWCASAADQIKVSFTNVAPVANASTSQTAIIGALVTLDGSASQDADGDLITYSWTVTSKPAGSLTELSDASAVAPTLTPDTAGTYVIQLTVNDGLLDSEPSTIQVQVITRLDATIAAVQTIATQVAAVPPTDFKNANMQNALLNKLNAVIANIEAGNYEDAIGQVSNDILGKTDGCAETVAVDKNDWIRDCASQSIVYPFVIDLIDMLQTLIDQG